MIDRIRFEIRRVDSPVGMLTLALHGHVLFTLSFGGDEEEVRRSMRSRFPSCQEGGSPAGSVEEHLAAYFGGDLSAVERIEVVTGGTPFQRDVWTALRTIPAGTTTSYGALAQRIGRPKATRAVGLANGSNPVAIVVPCHRVIGSDLSLTGYGGGLDRKRWLLRHEQVPIAMQSTARLF
jgi:methylated-DNA-[protein]-cysteine S-methyltransferase